MKTMLVATDLSARSDRALERAVALANQHQAKLVVLHVVDEDQHPSVVHHLVETARRAIHDDLSARIAPQAPRAGIEVRVEVGRDFADIIRHADALAAEVIVLGTHRMELLEDMFRGTTAERVLRKGRAPVLLVKDAYRRPYGRVLVAVDFSIHSRRAVEVAVALAPSADVHLLHAFHVPFGGFLGTRDNREQVRRQQLDRINALVEEEFDKLTKPAPDTVRPLKRVVREGETRSVIHQEVQRIEPDLLVVGTHGRTGVGHALFGSVAEELLGRPPCDVLAVKAW